MTLRAWRCEPLRLVRARISSFSVAMNSCARPSLTWGLLLVQRVQEPDSFSRGLVSSFELADAFAQRFELVFVFCLFLGTGLLEG